MLVPRTILCWKLERSEQYFPREGCCSSLSCGGHVSLCGRSFCSTSLNQHHKTSTSRLRNLDTAVALSPLETSPNLANTVFERMSMRMSSSRARILTSLCFLISRTASSHYEAIDKPTTELLGPAYHITKHRGIKALSQNRTTPYYTIPYHTIPYARSSQSSCPVFTKEYIIENYQYNHNPHPYPHL